MNRKSIWTILAVIVISAAIVAGVTAQSIGNSNELIAQAQVGHTFSYQGRLESGSTMVNDACDFQFGLFNAADNGSQIGTTQTLSNVSVNDGYFTVMLNFGSNAFTGEARWLEIQVRCPGGNGTYTKLTPRQEITPAPYAMSLAPGTTISGTNQQVMRVINTASTGWANAIYGEIHSNAVDSMAIYGFSKATEGWSNGVVGGTDSPEGGGVLGYSHVITGSPVGVQGDVWAPEARGVSGYNHATTGNGFGVFGLSNSPDGRGVNGWNDAGGDGVHGWTSGGDSNTYGSGVFGGTDSPFHIGIKGWHGDGGTAILGESAAGTGSGNGVEGIAHAPNSRGVSGWNDAGGNGVHGWTSGGDSDTHSSGVFGGTDSPFSVGIWAWHGTSGAAIMGESATGPGLQARSRFGRPIEAYGDSWDDVKFYVSNDGNVYADGSFNPGGADFAEMLPAQEGLEPGDVLIIGADGELALSAEANDTAVAGVYSTRPGIVGGAHEEDLTGKIPLAIVGVVPVKASAENGPIQAGDLLVTANTPGHAMKASAIEIEGFSFYPSGIILGKALEALEEGTGVIQILVTLQ